VAINQVFSGSVQAGHTSGDDMDKWLEFLPLLLAAVNAVGLWGLWSFRQATVSKQDFQAFTEALSGNLQVMKQDIDARFDQHNTRLTRVEGEMRHMPTHEDLGRLHGRLDGIGQTLSEVKGSSEAGARMMGLIHQHLLDSKGGKS
jgi:hypothetical protein